MAAIKSLKKPAAKSVPSSKVPAKNATVDVMSFGRSLEAYDLGRIGVPRPLKGAKAVKAARAAGIITASGKLTKRYR